MKLFEIHHTMNPEMAADQIMLHCKPFLEQINYKAAELIMYRGSKSKDRQYMKVDPGSGLRTIIGHNPNRTTVDTPPALHEALNKIYIELFGLPFRNGTFATGSYVQSTGYGNQTFVVLPIGEFKFLWSPLVEDAFIGYDMMDYITPPKVAVTRKPKEIDLDELKEETLDLGYKTTDLIGAIQKKHEIMLYCDHCIVLRAKEDNPLAVLQSIQRRGEL